MRPDHAPVRHLLSAALSAAISAAGGSALADEPGAPADVQAGEPATASEPIDVRVEGEQAAAKAASRDPDIASYVVRGEALRRPGATAAELLAASPGAQIARRGAGSDLATISIRGAPTASLPVYLAGVRLNDDITGGADLSTVPLAALDRIEVYRGNAPPDADRLGIGGAVFFEPRLPRGTHVGASLGAGSFGQISLAAFASIGAGDAGALFAFSRQSATNDFSYTNDRQTQDPADDRDEVRANGDATAHDAWAIGRVGLAGGGRLVVVAGTFAREQGVSGTTVLPALSARSSERRQIAAASARLPCASAGPGAALARCSVEITASGVASRRFITDPDGELGFLADRVEVSGERWQQAVRVHVWPNERWRLGGALFAGVDRLGVDRGTGALGAPERTRAARLALTGSLHAAVDVAPRVELFGLAGAECHTAIATEGASACGLGGPAGRLGVRLRLPLGIEVIASGGSYVRVPTLGELYGLSATVLGNADLVPERGATTEIELRWAGATPSRALRWYADVTGFARFADDLIAYRRTSSSAIAPFNVASARALGVELLAGAEIADHVRAEQSLTLLDPRDVTEGRAETNDRLPYQAAVTSTSTIEIHADLRALVSFVDRAALTGTFRYRTARTADTAGITHLPEQRELGLDLGVAMFGRRLTARVGVTNLLDVPNQDLLGFPLPSRAFHGAIDGTW